MGKLAKQFFRGQSVHRLDEKGRLRIPAKFREVLLQNNYTDALIVTRLDGCLVAYPPEVWEQIENKVASLSQVDPKYRAFMRYFISSAEECEFDKQGRILIPPVLRNLAGLDQEVLLAGALRSFEIWNRQSWESNTQWDPDKYQEIMQSVAGAGI